MERKDFSSVSARLQRALDEAGASLPFRDPRSHVRSVQLQIEAIARGDVERVLGEALPDVTLDIFAPTEFPWMRRASGVDELRRALQQNFGAVVDQQPKISNVFVTGGFEDAVRALLKTPPPPKNLSRQAKGKEEGGEEALGWCDLKRGADQMRPIHCPFCGQVGPLRSERVFRANEALTTYTCDACHKEWNQIEEDDTPIAPRPHEPKTRTD